MTISEINSTLATAHLIGHIQFFIRKAIAQNDDHTVKLHLQAIITACELNPDLNHLIEQYENQLKKYE
jgi:hypothetical protein